MDQTTSTTTTTTTTGGLRRAMRALTMRSMRFVPALAAAVFALGQVTTAAGRKW